MESISVFEIIKIGIGPSSSHTMGPWRSTLIFMDRLEQSHGLDNLSTLKVHLYGSLAKTGLGHGTDIAVLMGLRGEHYRTIDVAKIMQYAEDIKKSGKVDVNLPSGVNTTLAFSYKEDLVFEWNISLPFHPNGIRYMARMKDGSQVVKTYYSVGGGFVVQEDDEAIAKHPITTPHPCHNAQMLVQYSNEHNYSASQLIRHNETAWRTGTEIEKEALNIWHEIKLSIFRGISRSGILPGGLNVKRRAYDLNLKLLGSNDFSEPDAWIQAIKNKNQTFNTINKWISCFALAVNEENASFGRIVTAPTNGAAGVIPAVLMYAFCFEDKDLNLDDIVNFILVAGEVGTLFKKGATISAALGGCQAEIGVSSAMAAAALTEIKGGTPEQVMMAAEIAMEHHLGMTCDPIGGLVQIPCIERNSMGAIKAITAANIALESDPKSAVVSLDEVIKSMMATAKDMNTKYKETSEGGLAITVNVPEC